jgi:hypothetical protein
MRSNSAGSSGPPTDGGLKKAVPVEGGRSNRRGGSGPSVWLWEGLFLCGGGVRRQVPRDGIEERGGKVVVQGKGKGGREGHKHVLVMGFMSSSRIQTCKRC